MFVVSVNATVIVPGFVDFVFALSMVGARGAVPIKTEELATGAELPATFFATT
jgi:hypothetical protein